MSETTPVVVRPRRRGVGPFSLRQVTLAIGIVAIAGVLLTLANAPLGSIGPGLPNPEPSAYLLGAPIPGLRPGDLAPELTAKAADGSPILLTDLDGNPIRLADLRGKAVWLNFWASWCPPCQSETPSLRSLDARYRGRGLVIVGIQVQQIEDDARRYATTYSLRYPIVSDLTGDIFRLYRIFALPTQFFIDANGVIRRVVNGPLAEVTAASLIESILPAGSRSAPPASPTASPRAIPAASP
jgi:cytochrome c biogenesis protein CcmG/thiol:disulfide interchange protein DsbE